MLKRAISWLYWNWVVPRYEGMYSSGDVVEVTGRLRLRKSCDASGLHFSSNDLFFVQSSKVNLIRRKGEMG